MTNRTLRVLGLAVVACLAMAAPTWADATAELNIEDSAVTLGDRPDAQAIINSWRSNLGVDSVRIQAFWDRIETSPGVYNWSAPGANLDNAVRMVTAAGLQPVITIDEKGPVFASQVPSRNDGTYKPDPTRFGNFAAAVAQRYGASVTNYLVGNEPNQGTFLNPQRVGGQPYSPYWYRKLVQAAYPRIKANDRGSRVIIGEMAPIGGTSPGAGSVAPLIFLRELGCRNANYTPKRTGFCAGFRPARGDAIGYHPYSIRFRLPPFAHSPAELAGTGDMPRFFGVLDNVVRRGGILGAPGGRFNVYFTEYGYETKPPDPRFGFPPSVQSRYLQQGAYVAWRTPRVKMMQQYLYFDDPDLFVNGSNVTFQTGLNYHGGGAKPALASFPHPFYVDVHPPYRVTRARIWGQVRPGGVSTVTIESSLGGTTFRPIATVRTNFRGYFSRIQAVRRGTTYRYRSGSIVSDPIRIP